MNATTLSQTQSSLAGTDDMRGSVITSSLFHLFIVFILTVGLPFMPDKEIEIAPPINVEIVDISDISRTNKLAPAQPKPKDEKKKEEPKPSKPVPKQMTAEKPPELAKPKPPDIKEIEKPKEEPKKPEPLKREEIKKPEPPKEKPKEKPKPPEPVKPKVEEKAQENDFQSLLKNLTPVETSTGTDEAAPPSKAPPDVAQLAELADRLTISEQDALRRQLSQCWNILAGAEYAENLAVELRVFMNPDRTVNNAAVIDKSRYSADQPYRAAADAALRALRNPNCTPLELPEGKFEQWKVFVIRFDPKDVL